jgi:hypothetical protein
VIELRRLDYDRVLAGHGLPVGRDWRGAEDVVRVVSSLDM